MSGQRQKTTLFTTNASFRYISNAVVHRRFSFLIYTMTYRQHGKYKLVVPFSSHVYVCVIASESN